MVTCHLFTVVYVKARKEVQSDQREKRGGVALPVELYQSKLLYINFELFKLLTTKVATEKESGIL